MQCRNQHQSPSNPKTPTQLNPLLPTLNTSLEILRKPHHNPPNPPNIPPSLLQPSIINIPRNHSQRPPERNPDRKRHPEDHDPARVVKNLQREEQDHGEEENGDEVGG